MAREVDVDAVINQLLEVKETERPVSVRSKKYKVVVK